MTDKAAHYITSLCPHYRESGNVKIGQGVRGYFRTKHSSELNLSCFISLDGVNNAVKYGFFWFVFYILYMYVEPLEKKNIEINNSKYKIDDK